MSKDLANWEASRVKGYGELRELKNTPRR